MTVSPASSAAPFTSVTPVSSTAPAVDPLAATALAAALQDDPFYRAITVAAGDDAVQRLQMLATYFGLALAEAAQVGEVQCSGADGAALWLTPQAGSVAMAAAQAMRQQALLPLLGATGYAAYSAVCATMAQQLPAALEQAWYLSILGVRPQARGQGLAQRLLAPTLARADSEQAWCYLETYNPLSLPFYARLGFAQQAELAETVTGRSYWLLVRAPRGV